MNIWHDISNDRIKCDEFTSVIEIAKNGNVKYELDKETGFLKVDRILFTSTHYPSNYGFIPLTLAQDNDPLDVLVPCSEAILPMTLVETRPIGVLIMTDEGELDEKIIAIPVSDPLYSQYKEITDLPAHISAEIRHFFAVYKELEGKETAVEEIYDREEAMAIIKDCMKRYKEAYE